MRRTLLLISAIGSFGLLTGGAAAKPSADYRFEDTFASSVNGAAALVPEGPVRICPPCEEFVRTRVHGKRQGVWKWPEGDGLRLGNADRVLGHNGKTYTISMLVNLDTVSSYRKLVDFYNRDQDEGWYVYDEGLYPYDLDDFNYNKQRIDAGKWHQIVMTRDGDGVVRGYVDGEVLDKDKDKDKQVANGSIDKLHFLIDNEGGTEQSGGMIARMRIWENALDNAQVKNLGD